MARTARVKRTGKGIANYHLMSRANDRQFLFDGPVIKDKIIDSLRRAAEFSGVRPRAYINDNGQFKRPKNAIRPIQGRADLPELPVEVVARKDAFCRVIRFDTKPTYIILDEDKVLDGLVKKTITNRLTHSIEKLPCKEF